MTSLPSYRNPNNDPPRLGEIIHYVQGIEHDGTVQLSGIVSEQRRGPLPSIATVFYSWGTATQELSPDTYDPTDDPARFTWHFHHLTQ